MLILFVVSQALAAETLSYPEGVKPGDQLGGIGSEYTRYRAAFIRPPVEDDRFKAVELANDIKCDVCESILWYLVPWMKKMTEDDVMDILDGDFPDKNLPLIEKNDKQTRVMEKGMVGCNRFFKYVLREGYSVKKCGDMKQDICYGLSESIPAMSDLETWSWDKESVFTACEGTIKVYQEEVAEAIVAFHEEGVGWEEAVPKICLETAKCAKRRKKKKAPEIATADTEKEVDQAKLGLMPDPIKTEL